MVHFRLTQCLELHALSWREYPCISPSGATLPEFRRRPTNRIADLSRFHKKNTVLKTEGDAGTCTVAVITQADIALNVRGGRLLNVP